MIHHGRVPALVLNEFLELLQCLAVADNLLTSLRHLQANLPSAQGKPSAGPEPGTAPPDPSVLAAKCIDRFLHLQRVANRGAKRLAHIGDDRHRFAAYVVADADHGVCHLPGILHRFHERACAGFNIQHNRIRAGGDLLARDGAGNQRNGVDGGRHIPERVQFLSAGVRFPVWPMTAILC